LSRKNTSWIHTEGAVYYVVQKLSDLTNIIIPFFDKYPLQGVKVKDFEDFKHACFAPN